MTSPSSRPRGRPRRADPRRERGARFSAAEWAAVKARAAEAGLSAAEFVRRAALGMLEAP
jgi:hypothetical protein